MEPRDNTSSVYDDLLQNFNVVFLKEDISTGGGFADNIRMLDGLISFTEYFGLSFWYNGFNLERYSDEGITDPLELVGVHNSIEKLHYYPRKNLEGPETLFIETDLNYLITGTKDGSNKASKTTQHYTEKHTIDTKKRIVKLIQEKIYEPSEGSDKQQLSRDIKNKGFNKIALQVKKTDAKLIRSLGTLSKSLRRACQECITDGESDSGAEKQIDIVVHLRLGDTAVFTLEDGRMISSWGTKDQPKNPSFISNEKEAAYKTYSVARYLEATESFCKNLNSPVNVRVISDGYERGIERIVGFKEALKLSEKDIHDLGSWAEKKKSEICGMFHSLSKLRSDSVNVEIIWGEDTPKFMRSLDLIAHADVLLTTTGTFSRIVFDYFNVKEGSIRLGPISKHNLTDISNELAAKAKEHSPR